MAYAPSADGSARPMTREERKVIFASSLGTVFEWYDFYLYGSLAAVITAQFFSGVNATAAFIFALLAFAAGFAVRPFGAIFFGRLGDIIGRKYTFLVTIMIMGLSTFIVGMLPNYAAIGIAAPIILICLRLLQGLALGGEYGGAATYVAEHAPQGQRGSFTTWIQTTATLGLFLSLLVILGCRSLAVAGGLRRLGLAHPVPGLDRAARHLGLDPAEAEREPGLQADEGGGQGVEGAADRGFGHWENSRSCCWRCSASSPARRWSGTRAVLRAVLPDPDAEGRRPGGEPDDRRRAAHRHAVLRRLRLALRPDRPQADHHGGLLLAGVTYFPIFKGLTHYANPALQEAIAAAPVVVTADPAECSFQFNPVGTSKFTYVLRRREVGAGRSAAFPTRTRGAGGHGRRRVSDRRDDVVDRPRRRHAAGAAATAAEGVRPPKLGAGARRRRLPGEGGPARVNTLMVVLLLWVLVLYVTMVYGPIAAMLVELFPTRIRYTSMSLPYHIGNGWFGGFLPTTAFAIVAATGNIYYGPLVPDHDRRGDLRHRHALRARDEGRRHL